MKSCPRISVLTPTYNCGAYIARCIESVRLQGYPNVEHIVVDGGSTDGTASILSQFHDVRWISEKDEGEAHALNKAISMATGELLVRLNADDWLEPGAFSAVVAAYAQNPSVGVFYGKSYLVDEVTGGVSVKTPRHEIRMHELVRWWLTDTHPHQPAMYFTRAAVEQTGLFDQTLHYSIDYQYLLRLAEKVSFSYIDVTLASALIRRNCKSAGTEKEQIKSHWSVLLPFVNKLAAEERTAFWSDYFTHRCEAPLPFEDTRIPREDANGWDGLHRFLASPREISIEQRFARLFPVSDVQAHVLELLEGYAGVAAPQTLIVETDQPQAACPKVTLPRNVRRILWVRTDSIGDNVLASSTIEPIKRYYPNAEIAVVCREAVADLYQACPFVSKIIAFPVFSKIDPVALQAAIVEWKADLVLNTAFSRDTLSDLIVSWAAPAPAIGFAGDGLNAAKDCAQLSRCYTTLLRGVDSWTPELKKYDFFLSQIGISWPACQPVVWLDTESEEWAEKELASLGVPRERLVALLPGAQLAGRVYEQYSEALLALRERGYIVIGLGSEADGKFVQNAARGAQIGGLNLCGKTTLRQLAAVLSRVSLAIGAESGPAHIACAVGTPNVVVLGGGHFGRFMPYTALTSAVCAPLACARCDWNCRYEQVACVKDVDPLALRQAVLDRIDAPPVTKPQIYLSVTKVARRSLRTYPMIAPDLSLYHESGEVIMVTEGESATVKIERDAPAQPVSARLDRPGLWTV
jgi:ADP-heptose:LPS heptosyltransferase/glycosyltransferase involved in cell wall biosynthesis